MSAAYVEPTETDRNKLNEMLAGIEIVGAWYSAAQESMINR